MIRATAQMRDFVRRVVAFETGNNGAAVPAIPVAFVICEKLRPQWANLMGSIGYRTLLSRALALSIADVEWLGAVLVNADSSLGWAGEPEARMDAKKIISGSVVLLAELAGLLEGFIGETMALRIMQDVWPKLPPCDSDSDKGK